MAELKWLCGGAAVEPEQSQIGERSGHRVEGEKRMGAAEKKIEQATTGIVVTTEEQLRALIGAAVREALNAQRPEGYLDTEQAAAYLGTTTRSVQAQVERGTLIPDCRGSRGRLKSHRFSRKTLDAFLELKVKPTP